MSWLGYVWPSSIDEFYPATTNSFPQIPDAMYQVDAGLNSATGVEFFDSQKRRTSAVAPGIASLANSSPHYVNIQQEEERNGDEEQQVSFVTTRDVSAGEELFLFYGDEWHERYQKKLVSSTEYETLEDYQDRLSEMNLPLDQDKRNKLYEPKKPRLETDDDDDFMEYVNDIIDNYDPSN